jgi:hypothetical protein
LSGTRVAVLTQICEWIEGKGEHSDARMLLVTGQAGLGKSAIAHSVAHKYEQIGCFGAGFCFSKDRVATHFFRTISRQLADLDPSYAAYLSKAMTFDLENTTSKSKQLNDIFLSPFKSSSSILGPIVIVVDALDECVDSDRDELIQLLVNSGIQSLPPNIRLLVTSRPHEAQPLLKHDMVKVYDLNTGPASDTYGDILLFVQDELLKVEGLKQSDLELIASSSESVFQYASVVCHEICLAEQTYELPEEVFSRLVTGAQTGLDGLYTRLLKNVYDKIATHPAALPDFRRIMGRILVAQHRLTNAALVDFESFTGDVETVFRKNSDPVSKTLRPLAALLSGTNDSTSIVYPLHSSFRDYLLDKERSNNFWIGCEEDHHLSLATASLRLMLSKLQFNIAGLEDSYIPNKKVLNFKDKVEASISRSLSYACKYWATHLHYSTTKFLDFHLITALIQEKCLYWIEVLGLECQMEFAEKSFQFLLHWSMVSEK